jgi:hypothetical protein
VRSITKVRGLHATGFGFFAATLLGLLALCWVRFEALDLAASRAFSGALR